ncbi:hypothetical protein L9F63_001271, partial [Diploptera punctata]
LSRAVRLILLIWLLAMGLAVPQALQFGVVYEELPDGRVLDDEHTVCAVKRIVIPYSFEVSSLLFFVAPMTLITVLYALIGIQLRKSSLRRGGGSVRLKTGVGGAELGYTPQYCTQNHSEDGRKNFAKNAQIKATKHVVKMLIAVVVAFFICWAPFHAQRLLAMYANASPSPVMEIVYQTLTYTSGVLYYLSTTVNPVLYHIMSHKFREAFKDTLARYLGRRRARGGSLRRYLEADMARLHGSRRPIVVSFRRHNTYIDSAPASIADTEVSGGSTSTGPEKTRIKFNETYLSVLFRHAKSSKSVKGKTENNGGKKQEIATELTPTTDTSFIFASKEERKNNFASSCTDTSEGRNSKTSEDSDSLSSNTISKSEPFKNDSTIQKSNVTSKFIHETRYEEIMKKFFTSGRRKKERRGYECCKWEKQFFSEHALSVHVRVQAVVRNIIAKMRGIGNTEFFALRLAKLMTSALAPDIGSPHPMMEKSKTEKPAPSRNEIFSILFPLTDHDSLKFCR